VEEHACCCTLNYTATAYYQHRNSDGDKVTSAQSKHALISELLATGIASKLTN
jgi:hypothetical protein